jgi:hypothetical protein
MEKSAKPTIAHVSIIALFIVLVLFLSIPLVIFSTQQNQDIRQRAAQILPTPDIVTPEDATGYISGYVYFDENKDGERNYSENSISGIQIKITKINSGIQTTQSSSLVTTLTTDENGYFKYKFSDPESVPYTFAATVIPPVGYKTINTNPVYFSNIENGAHEMVEFGIFPTK